MQPDLLAGKKAPQMGESSGALPACAGRSVRLSRGEDFEKIVFAVLLGEEQPRPVCLESFRSDQSVNRTVSFSHVEPRRFVVFFPNHARDSVQSQAR